MLKHFDIAVKYTYKHSSTSTIHFVEFTRFLEMPETAMPGKRVKVSQSEFPRESLSKALSIAEALWENFAGKDAAPHEIALALDVSPTSGSWRNLCGTSIAYGLTEGGYNANRITLTPLGRQIVAPTAEGDDAKARGEAILNPRVMGEFFRKYDKAKFPKDSIAENVLVGLGLPKDRVERAVGLLKENGRLAGILHDTKTGVFVALSSPNLNEQDEAEVNHDPIEEMKSNGGAGLADESDSKQRADRAGTPTENNNVFISHGKNRKIVTQLKELLTFGKLTPIVSVENETASIPVPQKVFEDMRRCSAAVIHVEMEGEFIDPRGNRHLRLNQNVLIEIGAAMALYDNRFVLLVEKGVELPSNLQGLYRCEYEGDQLDYAATMKLLKTFNEFR